MNEKKKKNRHNGETADAGNQEYLPAEQHQSYQEMVPEDKEQQMASDINLFTDQQMEEMLANGLPENTGRNHIPVAHIEVKRLGYTYLITEVDSKNPDIAFGLCDYNTDIKFSTFNLKELKVHLEKEHPVFSKNLDFAGKFPIAVYAKVAETVGTIVTDDKDRLLKPLFENFSNEKWSDKSIKLEDLKLS